jgi:hypothetical protein
LDFTYRRYPRQIKYSGHESNMRGSVVFSDTAVGQPNVLDLTGTIVRKGTGADFPGPIESMTPYVAEYLITGPLADGGEYGYVAPIAGVAPNDPSVTYKCLFTDPADVARHMQTALHSCASYWLDRIRGGKADQSFSTYQRDLRLALEQDQLAPLSGRTREIWHDGGWRSPLKADEGA